METASRMGLGGLTASLGGFGGGSSTTASTNGRVWGQRAWCPMGPCKCSWGQRAWGERIRWIGFTFGGSLWRWVYWEEAFFELKGEKRYRLIIIFSIRTAARVSREFKINIHFLYI